MALPGANLQREIDGIFQRVLLEGASAKQKQQPLAAASLVRLPRWKKADPLVKSYLGNTLHLLGESGWLVRMPSLAHIQVGKLECTHAFAQTPVCLVPCPRYPSAVCRRSD